MSYFMHVDVTNPNGEIVVSNRDSIAHDKRTDAHALAGRYVDSVGGYAGTTVKYHLTEASAPFGHWTILRRDGFTEWVSVVSA